MDATPETIAAGVKSPFDRICATENRTVDARVKPKTIHCETMVLEMGIAFTPFVKDRFDTGIINPFGWYYSK